MWFIFLKNFFYDSISFTQICFGGENVGKN